ncbi:MAG: MoaD/ThiS family protein [Candidatus Riflebacteria bacterium]|nr:MoaD/ThiS family protein [Candidatus Riflebacteria bacterium]
MSKVNIKLYTSLKELTGLERVQVDAVDVAGALEALAGRLAEDARRGLFGADGCVHSRITVCLNTKLLDPRRLQGLTVQEGDVLHLMPPITGG